MANYNTGNIAEGRTGMGPEYDPTGQRTSHQNLWNRVAVLEQKLAALEAAMRTPYEASPGNYPPSLAHNTTLAAERANADNAAWAQRQANLNDPGYLQPNVQGFPSNTGWRGRIDEPGSGGLNPGVPGSALPYAPGAPGSTPGYNPGNVQNQPGYPGQNLQGQPGTSAPANLQNQPPTSPVNTQQTTAQRDLSTSLYPELARGENQTAPTSALPVRRRV